MPGLPITLVSALLGLTICKTSLGAPVIDPVAGEVAKDPVAKEWINKGAIKLVMGDLNAARSCFDAAIKIEPKAWAAFVNRGVVSYMERKWAAALSDFNASLRLQPTETGAAVLRAYANARLGNCRESMAELNHLTRILPLSNDGRGWVWNLRARLRLSCREASMHDPKAALADANMACKLTRFREFECLETLAQACAETGDFESAVKYERQAIAMVNKLKNRATTDVPKTLKHMEEQIAIFQQHRTSHEWQ